MSNENLRLARQVKNDEFYTRYEDIEKELIRYKEQFKGKIVYCNCDAPESNFIKFFNDVRAEWQIKEVLHTSLKEGVSYDSPKALELLDKCDIVVTNPPFSKVRNEFLPLIERSGKQFLFIGNLNMATFKEVFPLIRDGKLWTGYTHPKEFLQPDGTYKKFGNTLWWTNMFVDKPFTLNPDKKYHGNEDKYPRYDNYDAINVDKLADIPSDYSGVMGVPVTFIEHYVPPLADRGGIGSEYTDSEKEQMIKTSELTDDTTICDTLSPLAYNKNLRSRERERVLLPNTCSGSSDMSTTWATEQISDSLKSMVRASTNEYCSTVFSLIGVTEENGVGLSGGQTAQQPRSRLCQRQEKVYQTAYKILGIANNRRYVGDFPCYTFINGKSVYNRVLIQRI